MQFSERFISMTRHESRSVDCCELMRFRSAESIVVRRAIDKLAECGDRLLLLLVRLAKLNAIWNLVIRKEESIIF